MDLREYDHRELREDQRRMMREDSPLWSVQSPPVRNNDGLVVLALMGMCGISLIIAAVLYIVITSVA